MVRFGKIVPLQAEKRHMIASLAPVRRQGFCLDRTVGLWQCHTVAHPQRERELQRANMHDAKVVPPIVFSARELGRAAGVPARRIRAFIAAGEIQTVDGEFVTERDAAVAMRALVFGGALSLPAAADGPRPFGGTPFALPPVDARSRGLSLLASTVLHAVGIAGAIVATAISLDSSAIEIPLEGPLEPSRLVFLAQPGPGGGGGGGGLRVPVPPPKAERKGTKTKSSPLPKRRPPKSIEPVNEPDPPKPKLLENEPLPPLMAPLVTAPAQDRDRLGVLEETGPQVDSRGPGSGGGVGSGDGTGVGGGDGAGVGPGSGGGIGGGPYRPGSGIEAPRLLHEVKPGYTEDARQQGLEGDVILEIVVQRDGTVGDVRILQSLGDGLDQSAVEAVRRWRFEPARRLGSPVDVLVEVAVEFRLR